MRAEPVFPSLGSTMGGVATHSYVVSEGAGASSGSMGAPLTYVAFQHPGAGAPMSSQDDIRTIFVTGFPDNVNERELHNLCRFIPGYEASQVSIKPNQQPQVFVLFSSSAHARQALEALAGLPFDVQQPAPGKTAVSESAGTPTASASQSAGSMARPPAAIEERLLSASADGPKASGDASTGANRFGQYVSGTQSSTVPPSPTPLMQHGSSTNLASAASAVVQATRQTSELQPSLALASPTQIYQSVQMLPPVKYNLRCEMAHKNLYVKDGDPSVRRPHRPIVMLNNPLHMHPGMGSSGAVGHLAPAGGTTNTGGTSYIHDVAPMYTQTGGNKPVPHTLAVHPLMAAAAGGQQQQVAVQHHSTAGVNVPIGMPLGFLPVTNRGDNPPCNTLFIGNLSDQVSELELLHLLSGQPGYRQMKLVRGPRQVSCFVEFEDTVSAQSVHNSYQGAVLASSDRGGIRIQYSKNPFGRRCVGSSNPGSNMAALRSAVSLQGSTDLSQAVSSWPVVTYHTVPQQQQAQQQQPGLPSQHTITYY